MWAYPLFMLNTQLPRVVILIQALGKLGVAMVSLDKCSRWQHAHKGDNEMECDLCSMTINVIATVTPSALDYGRQTAV